MDDISPARGCEGSHATTHSLCPEGGHDSARRTRARELGSPASQCTSVRARNPSASPLLADAEVAADFLLQLAPLEDLGRLLTDTIAALVARRALEGASSVVAALLDSDLARVAGPWTWLEDGDYPRGEWCERFAVCGSQARCVGAIRRSRVGGNVSWEALVRHGPIDEPCTAATEIGLFEDWEEAALSVDAHLRAQEWGLLGEVLPCPPPDRWPEDDDPTPF